MANPIKWVIGASSASILTTELNSLATATLSAASNVVDNSSGLHRWAQLELLVTYGTNPSTGGHVAVYIAVALDGTNYSDVQRDMMTGWVGAFPLRATTAAQRPPVMDVRLPPYKLKFFVDNQAGQTMAASGNILAYGLYNEVVT